MFISRQMFRCLSTLARLTPAALAPAVALRDEKSARGAPADLIDKSEARRGDGTYYLEYDIVDGNIDFEDGVHADRVWP